MDNKTWLYVAVGVVVLVLAYFLFFSGNSATETASDSDDVMMEEEAMMEEDAMMEEEGAMEEDAMMEDTQGDSMMEEDSSY